MKAFIKKRKNWILLGALIIFLVVGGLIPKDFGKPSKEPKCLFEELLSKVGNIDEYYKKNLIKTNNNLDLAIIGNGYFKVLLKDQSFAYTREGKFNIDDNGKIILEKTKAILYPEITLPEDILSNLNFLYIDEKGTVSIDKRDNSNNITIGQIKLYKFDNPKNLLHIGNSLYRQSNDIAIEGTPYTSGFGNINQGYIEDNKLNIEFVEIEYNYNLKINPVSKIFIKEANNWYKKENKKVIDKIKIEKFIDKIINIQYLDIINIEEDNLLFKWQISTPNFIIKLLSSNNLEIKLIIGTDSEELGYYYVAANDDLKTIYKIKDHDINSIRRILDNR